jgi:polyisoprenoid-binding protein YceI
MKTLSVLFAGFWLLSGAARAANYQVDMSQSLVGAVVFKAGFGKALAHNHLVFGKNMEVITFEVPDNAPLEGGKFYGSVKVADIAADEWAVSQKWQPLLTEAGLLSKDVELSEVSAGQREDIEKELRGSGQLNGEKFPKVEIKLLGLSAAAGQIGKIAATHRARMEVSVHGVTKEVDMPARIQPVGNDLNVTVSGPLKFTDFGIEPISAMLGAIKNKDEFALFVHLVAKKGS